MAKKKAWQEAGWLSDDVIWHSMVKSKGAKEARPLAYSTKAANDLVVLLAQGHPEFTVKEVLGLIAYDQEARKVLQAYVDAGQGDFIASKHFR